jgi:copper chaperone CopZ
MPRFLRLKNTVIHVPSVSNVSMGTSCLGKPYLAITYHTSKKVDTLCFSSWSDCESGFNAVKEAVKEIDSLLVSVPLTAPEKVTVEVAVQTEEIKEPGKVEEVVQAEPIATQTS